MAADVRAARIPAGSEALPRQSKAEEEAAQKAGQETDIDQELDSWPASAVQVSVDVQAGTDLVEHLIRHKGMNIRIITEKTTCVVTVDRDRGMVTLVGSRVCVVMAEKALGELATKGYMPFLDQLVVKITVPGRLLNDRCIRCIRDKTGCSITLERDAYPNKSVSVIGQEANVRKAEQYFKEIADCGCTAAMCKDFKRIEEWVHLSDIPRLIGRRGSVVRSIRDKYRVWVDMPDGIIKSNGKRPVIVAGSAPSVSEAIGVIRHIVMYYHHELIDDDGSVHQELELPSWTYGIIIGRSGCERRHIERTFGVVVNIPHEHSANQNVILVGQPRNIDRAVAYINKIVWPEPKSLEKDDYWGEDKHEAWMDQYIYLRTHANPTSSDENI